MTVTFEGIRESVCVHLP